MAARDYFGRWYRPRASGAFNITYEATMWFQRYMQTHPDVLAFENRAWGKPVLAHISEYLNYEFTQPNHKEIRAAIISRGGYVIPADIKQWAIDTMDEMKHPEIYLKRH